MDSQTADFIQELVDGVLAGLDDVNSVRERLTSDELELFNKLLDQTNAENTD